MDNVETRALSKGELGQVIRYLRELRQWSQETLAEFAKTTSRTIQRVVAGAGASFGTLRSLASSKFGKVIKGASWQSNPAQLLLVITRVPKSAVATYSGLGTHTGRKRALASKKFSIPTRQSLRQNVNSPDESSDNRLNDAAFLIDCFARRHAISPAPLSLRLGGRKCWHLSRICIRSPAPKIINDWSRNSAWS